MPLPYDPTNPVFDTGANQGRSTPPGYNDPYYDPQRQAQLDGQQSFQPTPASPPPTTYQNWQDVFGSQPYSGNSTTMPTYQPDVFGSGGQGGYFGSQGGYPQGYFGDPSTWDAQKQFRLSDPDWSIP